jgi:SanA protein
LSTSPEHQTGVPPTPQPEDAQRSGLTPADAPLCAAIDAAPVRAARTRRRLLRRAVLGLGLLAVLAAIIPAAIDALISISTASAIAERVEDAAPKPVALLLGTSSKTAAGRPNQFYEARIRSAAELFHGGKVQGILVSGDNATRWYNEPITMQRDLIAAGVPAEYITLDYAGFRTLDSVIRAKEVFGQDEFVVVSQRFHASRAIFLARHFGIDATGFAAPDPENRRLFGVRAREVLARVAAVLDIVSGREPKFLGERETVRLRDGNGDAV